MTIANATKRSWLSDWVQPQHTAPEAVERYRASFAGDKLHLLTVPDFLVGTVADRIADFLASEAGFTQQWALRRPAAPAGVRDDPDHEQMVSELEWTAAAPERRFLRFAVGPGQPARMSVGWMRYLSLRAALHDARLAGFFEILTGLALGPVSSLSAHAMAVGDMLAPHNDVNLRRQLAFILYFSRDWRASYGGSLLIRGLDDEITRIVPTFNTLVLFEVTSHKSHRVEPIAEAAGEARRLSLSGWYDHALPSG